MVGVLITLLFAAGAMGGGQWLVGRWTKASDPAEALGIHGLIGLGTLGLLTLPIGLIPGGLKWGLYIVAALAVAGAAQVVRSAMDGGFKFSKPEGASLLALLAIGVGALFSLVAVLAPSDTLDWDTLAYHLAVPKLWLESGQIHYIPFIHQSNFPFTVEDLFAWGLTWGGQSGAKAFTLAFFIFGLFAVFGMARKRYGTQAGWWAATAFATIPVILWESGTGYIDVPHGLYGGLGVLLIARFLAELPEREAAPPPVPAVGNPDLWLGAILLGFAAGTKYTGLEIIGVTCLVLLGQFIKRRRAMDGVKGALLIGLTALAISGGWYVKTAVYTGNPVFPFFFEKLGGRNWDQRRADIYRRQQQTFGAGTLSTRHDPSEIGNAVLGLAYQPGRYVDPDPTDGNGTPLGSIGVAVLVAALLWALSGRLRTFEVSVLCVAGISVFVWFFLSQQSRYVVPLCIPLAVLAGGLATRLAIGRLMAGVIVAQAAYSLYLVYSQRFVAQSQVALGKISPEAYQGSIAFYDAADGINHEDGVGKVALYDEVFGYLLDVPYVWANPPHSMLIPYDRLRTGREYAQAMKQLGFTHIYISLSAIVKDPAFVRRWITAMGLNGPAVPLDPTERSTLMADWETKWEVLFSDAVSQGLIVPDKPFKHGILFRIP